MLSTPMRARVWWCEVTLAVQTPTTPANAGINQALGRHQIIPTPEQRSTHHVSCGEQGRYIIISTTRPALILCQTSWLSLPKCWIFFYCKNKLYLQWIINQQIFQAENYNVVHEFAVGGLLVPACRTAHPNYSITVLLYATSIDPVLWQPEEY